MNISKTVRKVAFIGEKETFILRAIMEKVEAVDIQCLFVRFSVNSINYISEDIHLYVLYIDESMRLKEDILHFLSDMLDERGDRLVLVGDQIDLGLVSQLISPDLIYNSFSRPINNAEFVDCVKGYFDKSESGEFKKRILIVDDDPQYLSLVRQWLKDTYRVAMANSGLQAIKYLGKNKVDLILLDHEMPVTSGPMVLEMLRSEPETCNIPVIFLTGKGDKESVMAVVALKPEGYFLKNITRGQLLEKLQEFFIMHNDKTGS